MTIGEVLESVETGEEMDLSQNVRGMTIKEIVELYGVRRRTVELCINKDKFLSEKISLRNSTRDRLDQSSPEHPLNFAFKEPPAIVGERGGNRALASLLANSVMNSVGNGGSQFAAKGAWGRARSRVLRRNESMLLLLFMCVCFLLCSCSSLLGAIFSKERQKTVTQSDITNAVEKTVDELVLNLSKNNRIAVLGENAPYGNDEEIVRYYFQRNGFTESQARQAIKDMDRETFNSYAVAIKINNSFTSFTIDDVEYFLINAGFRLVDRKQLEKIREEQDLQYSGEVDDDSAVSIGKLSGAQVVITIVLSYFDGGGRVTLKALDVQTAEIIAIARHGF
jgi:hypothetical protein